MEYLEEDEDENDDEIPKQRRMQKATTPQEVAFLKVMHRYSKLKMTDEIKAEVVQVCNAMLMRKQSIAFEVSMRAGVNSLIESAKLAVDINPEPPNNTRVYEPHIYKSSKDGLIPNNDGGWL